MSAPGPPTPTNGGGTDIGYTIYRSLQIFDLICSIAVRPTASPQRENWLRYLPVGNASRWM
jgi:hypothetical protein